MDWNELVDRLLPDLPVAALLAWTFIKTNEYWRKAIVSITTTYEARITFLLDRHTEAIAREQDRDRAREADLITLVKMLLPRVARKR